MGSHVLYDAVILYEGLILTSHLNQVNINAGVRMLDDSVFGDDTEVNKAGPLTASASVVGFWDADDSGDPDKTLFNDVGGNDKLLSAFPQAAAEGAVGFALLTSRSAYSPAGSWGEQFKITAEGQGRDRLVNATVLSNTTETSSDTGTARQIGIVQGWNEIVAGSNDKLDFDDGGGEENATITPGKYATGAALAAEIQTRMDALTADNITVTYSTVTHKFTIASDGATLSLKWATGANAATTIGDDIGFDTSADDTGSTSYAADNISLPTPQKLYAFIHVTDSSGDGDQTLDVTVKSDSAEGFPSGTTRITFTQVGTSVGAQFAAPIAEAISDDWWRVEWTISGIGSPSFTFLVGIGIMYDIGADLT